MKITTKEKEKWKVVLDYFCQNPGDLLGAFPSPRQQAKTSKKNLKAPVSEYFSKEKAPEKTASFDRNKRSNSRIEAMPKEKSITL